MEKMHIVNRVWLTEEEWQQVVALAKANYAELEWEATNGGDFTQFDFVKQ